MNIKDRSRQFKIIFIIYLIVLIMITVIRPWAFDYKLFGGSINLSLLTEYKTIIQGSIGRFIYLFVGNIIWFIPLGFCCVRCRGKSILTAALSGLMLSLFIEIMQYVLGTGVSELDDLILNTFGSLAGGTLAYFLKDRIIS